MLRIWAAGFGFHCRWHLSFVLRRLGWLHSNVQTTGCSCSALTIGEIVKRDWQTDGFHSPKHWLPRHKNKNSQQLNSCWPVHEPFLRIIGHLCEGRSRKPGPLLALPGALCFRTTFDTQSNVGRGACKGTSLSKGLAACASLRTCSSLPWCRSSGSTGRCWSWSGWRLSAFQSLRFRASWPPWLVITHNPAQ